MKIISPLKDNWIFDLKSHIWIESLSNLNSPSERYGSQMIELDKKNILLFGGFDITNTLNDLWLFNRETNIWTEIKNFKLNNNNNNTTTNEINNQTVIYNDYYHNKTWPSPIKDFSIIKYSSVKLKLFLT